MTKIGLGGLGVVVGFGLLVSGCGESVIAVGPTNTESEATPSPSYDIEDPGDANCDTLSRERCRRSLVCTLVPVQARTYACRRAAGNCQVGLSQTVDSRDRCEDRDGCTWNEGGCYCGCNGAGMTAVPDAPNELPQCDCGCAGGPPPGCRPR